MKNLIKNCDVIIVGAGLYGSTVAHQLSTRLGKRCLVLDKRDHIGGNCYTFEKDGINVHAYGPHIFHTSNRQVWEYINSLTDFNSYRHQCRAMVGDTSYSMPINLDTINRVFGINFTPTTAEEYISKIAKQYSANNFKEQVIGQIGHTLYKIFFEGYPRKQWGRDPESLPASVGKRLPVRFNYNNRYYNDLWEGIPVQGYTPMFEKQLNHELIHVELSTDFFDLRDQIPADKTVIYTGPIDRYFDYKHGMLGWRTLDFEFVNLEVGDFQGVTQMNYPEETVPWTRIIEYKHFHPERNYPDTHTVISREYPRDASVKDQPYYPIKTEADMITYRKYQELAKAETNVIFGGRLAEYMYYDMHQVIGSALNMVEKRFINADK